MESKAPEAEEAGAQTLLREDAAPAEAEQQPAGEARERWSSKLDFILSCVGLCIGLGNVWRFPYLCYENGGGIFLVPYFITLFFAGIPMLMLELSLGQMLSVGGLGVWRCCPIFKGVGFAANIMAFWLNVYYIVVVAYALFYLGSSFSLAGLPWKECSESWNTACCRSAYVTNDSFSCTFANVSFSPTNHTWTLVPTTLLPVGYNQSWGPLSVAEVTEQMRQCVDCGKETWNTPVAEFWELRALSITDGVGSPGGMRWELLLTLAVAWTVCYFCIFKGVQWTGKIVYLTALFPYVLLFILLIRGLTLDGAAEGLEYYLKPNLTKITESKIWLQAASQVFFSLGLGLGTHIALGSYNPITNNCFKDALLIGSINSCTSIFAGMVIFSVIGFMAKKQKRLVSQVAASGPGLAFLAYPSALSELPAAPFWSAMFFLMLFFVGIDSQFCTVEGFITAVIDEWPVLRRWRKLFVLGVCAVSFVIGLATVTRGGMYIFKIFDHYAASGPALLLLIFFECVAFSWSFGIKRLVRKMKAAIGVTPPTVWQLCVTVLCPVTCLGIFTFSLLEFKPLSYTRSTAAVYRYPPAAQALGVLLALSSVSAIPAYAVYCCVRRLACSGDKSDAPMMERVKRLFRTDATELSGGQMQLQMVGAEAADADGGEVA